MKNNLNRALSYCSKNIRSKSEVLKKLNSWKLDKNEETKIINFLEQQKFFLEDEEYVSKFLDNLSSIKGYSKIQVKVKLLRKGIPSKLIETKVSLYFKNNEDLELKKFINKNIKKINAKPRELAIKFLLSKGFSYNSVLKHVQDLTYRNI